MVASGLRGLAALGLDIPADPSKEMLDKAVAEVNELLGQRSIADLLNNPPATDERAKALTILSLRLSVFHSPCQFPQGIQMLISKMAIGFLFTNPLAYTYALANGVCNALLPQHLVESSELVCVQVKVSIEYGHIAHTSLIYVWYAWTGCAMNRKVILLPPSRSPKTLPRTV